MRLELCEEEGREERLDMEVVSESRTTLSPGISSMLRSTREVTFLLAGG